LLSATIDSLVEDGYAGTTTRRVAARAGVTPGALQHHFESRTALVVEALRSLSAQLAEQFLEGAVATTAGDRERAEALIDRLWEVHRGDLFNAYLELWLAARTDPDLASSLEQVAGEMALQVLQGAVYAFPDLVARPGFAEAVATGLATLRGLALEGFLPGSDPEALWPSTREHLVALFERAAARDQA
jgi:AcrR family transcriptional regulator